MAFVVMVDSETFHGKAATNPFNFEHFNLTEFSVQIDGQSYPNRPYQTDFSTYKSLDAYDGLQDVLGRRFQPQGSLMFDRSDFARGYTILAANLAPSGTGRESLGLIKEGNLSLSLAFSKPLDKTIMVCTLLLFDTLLEINSWRQLITDFTG